MKITKPNLIDIKLFGSGVFSRRGTGSGAGAKSFMGNDVSMDGHLWATFRIEKKDLETLWSGGEFDNDFFTGFKVIKSDFYSSENDSLFDKPQLYLGAYKVKSFLSVRWCGFCKVMYKSNEVMMGFFPMRNIRELGERIEEVFDGKLHLYENFEIALQNGET